MKSPFPGMNPWLEGYLWPDVHSGLARTIVELIAPKIAPNYVARIDVYTVDDTAPESEIGIMYPDVEILKCHNIVSEPTITYGEDVLTAPNVIIPTGFSIPVRIPVVEIRDRAKNKLITAIEILSPVNKREPGLKAYQKKRADLHKNGVNLLEIDLLRRGTRPFAHSKIPQSHYQVLLSRANTRQTDVWTINIQDRLPNVPIPLLPSEPDVILDLGKALSILFERRLYYLSTDYTTKPPPPVFEKEDMDFIESIIKTENK